MNNTLAAEVLKLLHAPPSSCPESDDNRAVATSKQAKAVDAPIIKARRSSSFDVPIAMPTSSSSFSSEQQQQPVSQAVVPLVVLESASPAKKSTSAQKKDAEQVQRKVEVIMAAVLTLTLPTSAGTNRSPIVRKTVGCAYVAGMIIGR